MEKQTIHNKGSFTVEATLVFSTVFLAIVALIYISILMYQQSYIQALANKTVYRGANTWNNYMRDIETGKLSKKDLKAGGLYWRLVDSNKQNKIDALEQYVSAQLDTYSLLKESSQVNIEIKDYIIYKELGVHIKTDYKIPIANLLKMFGFDDNYSIDVTARAVINDPVEFIRNTDFIFDIEKELEKKNPKLAEVGGNIRDIMSRIKGNIAKFFNGDGGAN